MVKGWDGGGGAVFDISGKFSTNSLPIVLKLKSFDRYRQGASTDTHFIWAFHIFDIRNGQYMPSEVREITKIDIIKQQRPLSIFP